jgi:hypothetical protein
MLTSEHPRFGSFSTESSLTPSPSSVGDVSRTKNPRRVVAYIELPPLTPAERIKHEAVLDRNLPQDFDYDLPLSDHVVIGEYRDDTTLWYYVENADGVVHRVSILSIVLVLVGDESPSKLLHDISLKHLFSQRHSLTPSPSIVSIFLFRLGYRLKRFLSLLHIRTQEEDWRTPLF